MTALSGYFEGPGGPYAAYVGIDWADQSHRVCLLCEGSAKQERMQIGSDPASVIKFARWLQERFGLILSADPGEPLIVLRLGDFLKQLQFRDTSQIAVPKTPSGDSGTGFGNGPEGEQA